MNRAKEKVRTVTFLTREQLDFLDKIGKDALFYRGSKLSRAEILSELVDLIMELGVDVKKMNLAKENLTQGILKIINGTMKTKMPEMAPATKEEEYAQTRQVLSKEMLKILDKQHREKEDAQKTIPL